ncbi:hypothetical protein DPMN_093611 [Dreissena polymorpha]|uniref:Uncharacterized protein n=1 Tax=Dreissena polymorpha TaxID=45954 RepID=A0A9D4R2Q4_DREPO|nr:hypothetical protein DPMN_093611 [Dreissena polymorpha]
MSPDGNHYLTRLRKSELPFFGVETAILYGFPVNKATIIETTNRIDKLFELDENADNTEGPTVMAGG